MVTDEPAASAMIGEGDRTAFAGPYVSTRQTLRERSISSPIEKQDHLFTQRKPIPDTPAQRPRKDSGTHSMQFIWHFVFQLTLTGSEPRSGRWIACIVRVEARSEVNQIDRGEAFSGYSIL
jgi:hypothetical protein